MAETKTYTVLDPVDHDGQPYAVGDSIELDEGAAPALLAAGVVGGGTSAKAAAAPKADDAPARAGKRSSAKSATTKPDSAEA